MLVRNVDVHDTVQLLNVFGSLSDCATSTSLTGGRSPDPAPSSCTPGFPSFFGAFCSTAVQLNVSVIESLATVHTVVWISVSNRTDDGNPMECAGITQRTEGHCSVLMGVKTNITGSLPGWKQSG